MPRYNEIYFDFGMNPEEAEMLYRILNHVLNHMELDDPNFEATRKFHDRVLAYTVKHPCRYGADAL